MKKKMSEAQMNLKSNLNNTWVERGGKWFRVVPRRKQSELEITKAEFGTAHMLEEKQELPDLTEAADEFIAFYKAKACEKLVELKTSGKGKRERR
jgi:negative regulator of genetic competence, sporulation and motility